jgi:hypothetical protein
MPSVADALHAILSDILAGRINKLAVPVADDASIEERLRAEIFDLIQSMRPGPYPMSCGFSVHGARVAAARSNNRNVACRIRDSEQGLVSVDTNRAASVLLEMADGTGVVMPAIPGFVASLVFRAGELAHVGYEATSPAGPAEHLDSVRALGATLGVAAGLGFLQLHKRDVLLLAKRFAAWFPRADPALALYYAYACQDAGMRGPIKDVAFELWMSMTPYFFDINLLANQARDGKQQWPVVPAFPLLSRGWSLLNAFGATLPAEWRDLQRHLRPSLWSLFDKEGTERLRTLFNPPKE